MYADPRLIRKHVYKICLDDDERAVVDELVQRTGQQRQVILRELLLASLARLAANTATQAA
jgi:predicted transcriptional regulator